MNLSRVRDGGLPILLQVAALAVCAVLATQAIAIAVLLLAPPPAPQGFNLKAASDALVGKPAETTDGRALKRRIVEQPPAVREPGDPMAHMIRTALAERLNVPEDRLRVSIERRGPYGFTRRDRNDRGRGHGGPDAGRGPPPLEARREHGGPPRGDQPGGFDPFSERLTFPPLVASLQLEDGRWAVVEPPRDWLSPWQKRLILTLFLSLLLMAPLVWWVARRLTRPIRAFAAASERLGADPDAPPLEPTGPAEVRSAIATFNAMHLGLKDHMRQRSQTIAAIAHDLRTPLTRLRFRVEQAPEALRDKMAADIEEMDALIGQTMAYVRGQAAPERRERFDLAALAAECADRFAETGTRVVFEGDVSLPVLADPDALQRALDNLIGNALRYAGAARVVASLEDGLATICVEDKGPGLPPEDLERVFEPFTRGERSRNRDTGGVGLGLAVARQAARAGGGDVILTLPEGGGVVARLTLPLTS